MNILAKFGLMKRSEHEAVENANAGLLRDILALRIGNKTRDRAIADLETEAASLRHDAQKWRDKLARDRAARKGVGK